MKKVENRLDKSLYYKGFKQDLRDKFGLLSEAEIWSEAGEEWAALERAYPGLPRDRREFVLPAVALHRAIEKRHPGKGRALLSAYGTRVGGKLARIVYGVTSLPGVSKLIWKNAARITERMSSEKMGYRRKLYFGQDGTVGVDILACPYFELCRELDAPDAAQAICAMDKAQMKGFRYIDYTRGTAVSDGDSCCEYRLRWKGKRYG